MFDRKQEYDRKINDIIELSELLKFLALANMNLQKRLDDGHDQYIALLGCGGSRQDSVTTKSNRYAEDLIKANEILLEGYKKELAKKVAGL